jgi:hypothetical protein
VFLRLFVLKLSKYVREALETKVLNNQRASFEIKLLSKKRKQFFPNFHLKWQGICGGKVKKK